METKDQLIDHLKNWVNVDKDIKALQKQLKEKRNELKDLNVGLISVMKEHEIDCFDTSDSKIVYSKSVRKGPLNKKHLERALSNYFQSFDKAKEACEYILESREQKEVEKVTRKVK